MCYFELCWVILRFSKTSLYLELSWVSWKCRTSVIIVGNFSKFVFFTIIKFIKLWCLENIIRFWAVWTRFFSKLYSKILTQYVNTFRVCGAHSFLGYKKQMPIKNNKKLDINNRFKKWFSSFLKKLSFILWKKKFVSNLTPCNN